MAVRAIPVSPNRRMEISDVDQIETGRSGANRPRCSNHDDHDQRQRIPAALCALRSVLVVGMWRVCATPAHGVAVARSRHLAGIHEELRSALQPLFERRRWWWWWWWWWWRRGRRPLAEAVVAKLDAAGVTRRRSSWVPNVSRYTAPAFCAYSQDAFASGTVRLADSIALALAAVPSRMRPAIPWVMPARRKRL